MDSIKFNTEADGREDIIEIDESLFGKKRKYHRGTSFRRQWVFGIIERGSRKTYFVPVTRRSQEELIPIIESRIEPGAKIFHDDWAVYRNLSDRGFKDDVVNHSKEFKSDSGACTNTIEGKTFN